jgi:WD40 repeat protein
LGTHLVDLTFVTAGNHGNISMHQIHLESNCMKNFEPSQPVIVKSLSAYAAHKMGMKAFAIHPVRDWCVSVAGSVIKLWTICTLSKTLTRIASIRLEEPPSSLAFTIRFGKTYILASTSSKLYFSQVSETQDDSSMEIDGSTQKRVQTTIEPSANFDLSNEEITLHSPVGCSAETMDIVACVELNRITVRSNKGAELRRFEGNFGNALSIAKVKSGGDDCFHLAVWDGRKREILVYDVLQGSVDQSVQLTGFKDAVNLVSGIGNDNAVFGSSKDKTLRIWKLPHQKSTHQNEEIRVEKCVALVNVGERVLALSEKGTLIEWATDDKGVWKSRFLTELKCDGNCKNEKMTSLSAIAVPHPESQRKIEDDEEASYILAVSCAKHFKVNLLLHFQLMTSRIRVELGPGKVEVNEKHFQKLESTPLSCALAIDKQVI